MQFDFGNPGAAVSLGANQWVECGVEVARDAFGSSTLDDKELKDGAFF